MVQDGVEGIIVPGRNPQKLAEAMMRIAANPSLGKTMGEAALKKGGASNTWQDYGDRLLKHYDLVLAQRRKHS
jgi:glycosyltransferase involved in cell wall biosynthesis